MTKETEADSQSLPHPSDEKPGELSLANDFGPLLSIFLWVLTANGLFFFGLTVARDSFRFHSLIGLFLAMVGGSALLVLKWGHCKRAMLTALLGGWTLLSCWPYAGLGVRAPVLYAYPVFILLTGWLLGRRAVLWLGGASVFNLVVLYWGEST